MLPGSFLFMLEQPENDYLRQNLVLSLSPTGKDKSC